MALRLFMGIESIGYFLKQLRLFLINRKLNLAFIIFRKGRLSFQLSKNFA